MPETNPHNERAILVGIITPGQKDRDVADYLDELAFLVDTAGGSATKRFIQRMDAPNSRTFVGSGKLAEISELRCR